MATYVLFMVHTDNDDDTDDGDDDDDDDYDDDDDDDTLIFYIIDIKYRKQMIQNKNIILTTSFQTNYLRYE